MKRSGSGGFSLLEVMVCAGIGMLVTVAAVPNMVTGIANMRLRSSMTSLAGVLQNCRVLAVKSNRHMTTHGLRQLVHRQKLILALNQLGGHALQLIFQFQQMRNHLGFGLESRLCGCALDASDSQITNHATT